MSCKGPTNKVVDLQYLKMEKNILESTVEKKLLSIIFVIICLLILFFGGPGKGLRIGPLNTVVQISLKQSTFLEHLLTTICL